MRIQAATFFDYGPNFPIMLSGDAGNPLTAVRGPTADTVGPCRIAETVVLADLSVNLFFRAVNQLGSLIMRTNASGARTDVEQYTEHGGVLQYPVAFDGQKNLISSVTSNSPESGITKLHLTSALLTSGALKGMTLVVSVLDIDSNTMRVGRVVDNDTDDVWVRDDDSIGTAVYHHGAIQNGFVIYKQQDANELLTSGSWDNVTTDGLTTDLIDTGVGSASAVGQWVSLPNGTWAEIISIPNSNTVRINGDRTEIVAASDPYVIAKLPYTNLAYSTAGQWTGESFASGETTLTDSSATFASYMVGWQIILDMEFPVAQVITAVPSATTLKIAGDVRTLTDPGKFYILFAPPFVNPANGTLADIVTAGEDDDWYDVAGSQYLWAGYRYVPPMVGYYDKDSGTNKGAQAGNNKLGNYHCNNRVYSIGHGRWLSPDQAARPFSNLFDYAFGRATRATDPSGLKIVIGQGLVADNPKGRNYRKEVFESLKRICPDEGITMDEKTGEVSVPDDFCQFAMACTSGEVNRGRPGQAKHEKGCALLRCVICSKHTVKIDHPDTTQNRFDDKDNPTKTRKKLSTGGNSQNKDDWENSEGAGGTVHLEGLKGDGTTGKVWHDDKSKEFTPSHPRILAHELAHACFGVQGAIKEANPDCPNNPWGRTDGWGNDNEYDADNDCANPIAKEIADDAKTRNNSNGQDTEFGAPRGEHG